MYLFDQLDSAALRKYALHLSRIEQESISPYLYSPVPTPPRSHRGNRVGSRPQIRSRPRTAEPHRSSSPREKKVIVISRCFMFTHSSTSISVNFLSKQRLTNSFWISCLFLFSTFISYNYIIKR